MIKTRHGHCSVSIVSDLLRSLSIAVLAQAPSCVAGAEWLGLVAAARLLA
jgi:hypothetical protein